MCCIISSSPPTTLLAVRHPSPPKPDLAERAIELSESFFFNNLRAISWQASNVCQAMTDSSSTKVALGVAAAVLGCALYRQKNPTAAPTKPTINHKWKAGMEYTTDADVDQQSRVMSDDLDAFAVAMFQHFGVTEEHAKMAADVLGLANLRGVDSHGIARLFTYYELLKEKKINPTPNIREIRGQGRSVGTIDGDNGLGLIVGPVANRIAMEKAEVHGSGFVSVCNTNHFGIAGYYPIEALKRDMIGMAMTNTTKLVAPCFGVERMLGTNPIAIAFPSSDPAAPIVIDMATSVVAYGKVEEYKRSSKTMPDGYCITPEGHPEHSPVDMQQRAGSLLTIGATRKLGQHKGYCLSAMVDILCAVLSGANWGPFCPPFSLRGGVNAETTYKGKERPGKGIGHFFGAYKIEDFRDVDEFKSEIDDWISVFRSTDAEPGKAVMIPGDPELVMYKKRVVEGIPIKPAVEEKMRIISSEIGIALPTGIAL